MKKKTLEQELKEHRERIIEEREDWKYINEHGCNDPSWPDGSNMNLVRNHILYYRVKIEEICKQTGMPLPEEYFDKRSGKMKKRINKYYPDEIRMKLGRSYSDYEATQRRSSFESLSGYMDTSGSAVPSTISEEVAASISMKDQERKRETLYGTMIGNGGDEDG